MSSEPVDLLEPFDQHMSEAALLTANAMRDKIQAAVRNINKAKAKKSAALIADSSPLQRVMLARAICCQKIFKNGSAILENPNRSILKKKYIAALKKYIAVS